jgi:hypothetical protein
VRCRANRSRRKATHSARARRGAAARRCAIDAGTPRPGAEAGVSAGESRYDSRAKPILSQRLDREGTRMDVLIGVIITFLVVILVLYLVNMLPLDARARQIVRAIVIIIGVISLLKYLAVF